MNGNNPTGLLDTQPIRWHTVTWTDPPEKEVTEGKGYWVLIGRLKYCFKRTQSSSSPGKNQNRRVCLWE